MSNLDYFSRGLIKAFERQRAMQQQVNVVSDDRDSTITPILLSRPPPTPRSLSLVID
ncbi:hypothetical protein HU724_004435 [Pseudomonas iranensis]|uniref:hypothetical protein n=1 Tax=Pseudomonas iranensis TaxID=2745503 RepID=UPI0016459969|nr:hypothetical protein [Pseudomonas iranensis]QXI23528.1 hypothetical protein HU724_004435 [Pseudomonas iranensis]